MDIPRNAFKAALAARQRQIGLWCTLADPSVAELCATAGFDWLLFDTEHSPIDALTALPLLQAVAPYPATPVVRPGWNDAVEIKKMLDLGAQTFLIPFVQNAQEAAAAVAAVRYPPKGVRGVSGTSRATRWGAIEGYAHKAEAEICLLVQVETAEALDNIEAIAAVDGVDGIFIGPADLGASVGHLGAPGAPEVKAMVLDAIARIRAAGSAPGVLTLDQGFAAEALEAGALFVAVDVDAAVLARGVRARAAGWKV
ncbi:MAG: 4-hydroxy-2-oxoheptanedioate aldolase [Paracoccaceae bacterium]|jgi:4-hydroxy-2-oxoheptanedioate aldolase